MRFPPDWQCTIVGIMKASFVEPMLLRRVTRLPETGEFEYEAKLDGYRAIAWKTNDKVHLHSRKDNDFSLRYPEIVEALKPLPNDTAVDGELIAVDSTGRPNFNLLQNAGSRAANIFYYLFDVMIFAGRDLRAEALELRRGLLEDEILPVLDDPIRYSPELKASLKDLIRSAREQGLEGLVAKRRQSEYQPGLRTGEWRKMRLNQGREFVVGGYTPSGKNFDALIFGYYTEDKKLMYVGRTRNGFNPMARAELFQRFHGLEAVYCPFVNLPERKARRWGEGLTASKMKDCRWLAPKLVGYFEFTEWTPDNHLRHSKFVTLREGKDPYEVQLER